MILAARSGHGRPGGRGTYKILVTLVSAAGAYTVVRAAAIAVAGSMATSTLPPVDYGDAMTRIAKVALDPTQTITPEMIRLAVAAARAAPMKHEPFFVVAKAEEQAGRQSSAIALLEQSRLRKSSHVGTRLHLLQLYGQTKNYPGFLDEMEALLRLSEDASRIFLPELVKLLVSPEARIILGRALAKEPTWRDRFLAVAAESKVRPQDALDFLAQVRKAKHGGDTGLEESFVIRSLINAGQSGRARALWLASLPQAERSRSALLFNGDFRESSSKGPFDWILTEDASGRAEITRSRGEPPQMDIFFYGGRDIALARQELALAPGNYRLAASAKSDSGIASGRLLWTIACATSSQRAAELPLEPLTNRYMKHARAFTIPPQGCAGQTLILAAEAGDLARPVDARIQQVTISRGK